MPARLPTPVLFFADWTLQECRGTPLKKTPATHQKAALAALNDWYLHPSGKVDGGILVMPTGGGKTFTAAHFLCRGPLSDGYKVLWLAHTHHLLEQAFHAFSADMVGQISEPRSSLGVRVVSGTPGHYPPSDIRPTDDVVLATLQTITRAHSEGLDFLSQFLKSAGAKLFIVFDEAHHAPAPSYRKLLVAIRAKGALTLGLTATPTHTDPSKVGWLKKIFPQGILTQVRAASLIADGILARPNFERVPTSVVPAFSDADYGGWLGAFGDLPEGVVASLAKNAKRNAFIAQTYVKNRRRYGRTIIFTDRWYQCEAIVEALTARGIRAGAVYSHREVQEPTVVARKRRDRAASAKVLDRFREGKLDVIVNVRMLTEGTDLPDAQTVFLTRQTASQILLTQMVGRALRGPKFGGTVEAYIVSFVDQWRHPIRWAEYDPLADGKVEDGRRSAPKHAPMQLISIELVKSLARQMDSGGKASADVFIKQMPVGWYRVTFDVVLADGDDMESQDQLVMVFDDERHGFDALIGRLLENVPKAFESAKVSYARERPALEGWYTEHLNKATRPPSDLLPEIFLVARHVAQGHGAPEFFAFEARADHDLDAIAKQFIALDLGPRAIEAKLKEEFDRNDRFWRALFPSFDQLRAYYYICQAAAMAGPSLPLPKPRRGAPPSAREADQAVKDQVRLRDGNVCLACGSARGLHVDHIVSVYHGGTHEPTNLQTLCKVCNARKMIREIRFTTKETKLTAPPPALEQFEEPRGANAGSREHWERFLRRTLNFTYECCAVSSIVIGGRGPTYYNWTIDLAKGNPPSWIKPHLRALIARVQAARTEAGKAKVATLRVTGPGARVVAWPK